MLTLRRLAEAGVGIALGAVALRVAPAQDGAAAPARSATPVGSAGAASAPQEPLREHADNVVDYTMHAVLDSATHTVHADGTIVWRNRSETAVHELWLHLYLNAFKNERTTFLRAPIGFGRGTATVADWGYIDVHKLVARELGGVDLWTGADKTSPGDPDDQTDIRVPLPRAIEPGESLTLDTAWDSKMPSLVERTGHLGDFYLMGQWFPKVARLEPSGQWRHFPFYHLSEFLADFGTYDVTVDVPGGFVVGATGTRMSSVSERGREVIRYHQADVHDFAWTAWSSFHEKSVDAEGVRIRALYPPGYDAVAEREIAAAKFCLRYFGDRFGAYPYPVLTLVHPPAGASEAGGMEYPTFITTGGVWYEPPFSHVTESVTIHEFGHQYFYGLVATDEQTWPVLDEGINSFAETEALRAMFGPGSGFDFLELKVGLDALFRAGSMDAVHNEPISQPAQAFASGGDYAALVYARTATVLATVSRVYGHDAFVRALGRYARKYRFEHPSLTEFIGAMRDGLGEEAARNLETAFLEKGWIDYVVASARSSRDEIAAGVFDRDGKRETVTPEARGTGSWAGWALVMRHGNLRFPVEIELTGADGSIETAQWDGSGDWIRVPYRGASALTRVTVDPAFHVTLDADLFNNVVHLAPSAGPWRTLERATYVGELGLEALMP